MGVFYRSGQLLLVPLLLCCLQAPASGYEKKDCGLMENPTGIDPGPYLAVSGFWDSDRRLVIYPLYRTREPRLGRPDPNGPYRLVYFNAADKRIRDFRFATQEMHIVQKNGSDVAVESGLFAFSVPFDDHLQRLAVEHKGRVIWQTDRSRHNPVVCIERPAEIKGDPPRLSAAWHGWDADGDTLFYLLEASTDQERSFVPLTGLVRDTRIAIDAGDFFDSSGMRDVIIALVCTDGLNTVRVPLPLTPPD